MMVFKAMEAVPMLAECLAISPILQKLNSIPSALVFDCRGSSFSGLVLGAKRMNRDPNVENTRAKHANLLAADYFDDKCVVIGLQDCCKVRNASQLCASVLYLMRHPNILSADK